MLSSLFPFLLLFIYAKFDTCPATWSRVSTIEEGATAEPGTSPKAQFECFSDESGNEGSDSDEG